ncbi:tetratricopeptide repeat protein [uncultured Methylobacterium sp.]|uniref:CHAT domain-containing tetratricopeptide repeat protein n=1 Tax=uncultured Methylobacterium sp. TaxID=157278 RepID=UPI0035CAD9A3
MGLEPSYRPALARPLAIAVLALFLGAQAPARPAIGNPLLDEAKAILELNTAGRYQEVLVRAKALLPKVREKFGASHPGVAHTQWLLAMGYRGVGRYDDAMAAIRATITLFEKASGSEDPQTVGAMQLAGNILLDQNRPEEADAYLERAAAATERRLGPAHPDFADLLVDRARASAGRHRIDEAEQRLLRALAIQETAGGPAALRLAYPLVNLAILYRDAGRYAEAEPIAKRALQIREAHLGPNHRDVASSLSTLGGVYLMAGRQVDAAPLFERAVTIAEKTFGPDHPRTAGLISDLAITYKDSGRPALAEPLLRRAVAIQEMLRGPDHPSVAFPINNLAVTLRALGRLDEAETLYRRALSIRERSLAPDHPDIATALGNLGNVLLARKQAAEAVSLHERALAIRLGAWGPNHPEIASSLSALAADHMQLGHTRDALESSRRAARIVIGRLAKASGLAMAGEIRNGRQVLETTLRLLKRGQDEKLLDGRGGEESFEIAQWMNQTAAAGAINRTAARLAGGGDALAALVREQQDLLSERESLDARLLASLAKPSGTRDEAAEQAMNVRSASIEARLKTLDARLAVEFPRYAGLITPKPVTNAEVAALIGAKEALVMFHLGVDAAYAYVITRERQVWYQMPAGTAGIEKQVRELRAGLDPTARPGEAKPFDPARAHALYQQLFSTAEPLIRDKPHLLLVASGALTSLPFHVLVTDKPEKPVAELADFRDVAWLARRHAVTVLPTVASLKVARSQAQAPAPLPYLGIGDPTFTAPLPSGAPIRTVSASSTTDLALLSRALAPLPETADEVRAVGRLLGASASAMLLRSDAREGKLKAMRLSDYRIIHFATHALVADETALFSARAEPALALTLPGVSSAADDGLLMASEVAQLKLNAEWILLSACNTAAGNKPGAEALSGLAQAFFYAGARNLLVSHWPVGSEATVRLTTLAIQAIAAEPAMAPAEALRRGMIALMQDGNASNSHPSFWAPFVMVGASGAASAEHRTLSAK